MIEKTEAEIAIVAIDTAHALRVEVERLKAVNAELLAALQEAIDAVKTFHGPDCWDIYEQHSPEMKRWTALIKKATA